MKRTALIIVAACAIGSAAAAGVWNPNPFEWGTTTSVLRMWAQVNTNFQLVASATNIGVASTTYATNAGWAGVANTATSALSATSAGWASVAARATNANWANVSATASNAQAATWAGVANTATSALSATSAGWASVAARATNANWANVSATASNALASPWASVANTATSALSATWAAAVDLSAVSNQFLLKSGATMTGMLTIGGDNPFYNGELQASDIHGRATVATNSGARDLLIRGADIPLNGAYGGNVIIRPGIANGGITIMSGTVSIVGLTVPVAPDDAARLADVTGSVASAKFITGATISNNFVLQKVFNNAAAGVGVTNLIEAESGGSGAQLAVIKLYPHASGVTSNAYIDASSVNIKNVAAPVDNNDAATKGYADSAWSYKSLCFPDEYQFGQTIPNTGNGEYVGYRILAAQPMYNAQYFLGVSETPRTNLTVELKYSFPVQTTTQVLDNTNGSFQYWNNATPVSLTAVGFLNTANWTNSSVGMATSIVMTATVNIPDTKMVTLFYKSVMLGAGTGYFNYIRYRWTE